MASETKLTRKERRQQRREEMRRQQAGAARRARTNLYLTIAIVAVLIVVAGALAWGPITSSLGRQAAQGRQFPDQGQQHIALGQPHAPYNSNPPTSGPHLPEPATWGIHEQPLPDEQLVHNLEHGGVVITYNCSSGCPELVEQLKGLVGGYRAKVLLAPRPNKDVPNRVTMTAWTWLDAFDDFDAGRIRGFIEAHKDRGPELVPD